jgi:signal transduction histidine kinase
VLVLLLSYSVVVAELLPISVIHSKDRTSIGKQCEFYLDASNAISIQSLLDSPADYSFTASDDQTLNFGPTTESCWVRFSYTSTDSTKQFLEISNSNLNEIDFYVVDGGEIIQQKKTGLGRPASDEELKFNVWLFELPAILNGKNLVVYVRVSDRRRVIIPLVITDLNSAIKVSHRTDFLFGNYFGAITIIAIINIFIFFYFRERLYLYYSLHIVSQILINGILRGYFLSLFGDAFYFLSPYVPGIAGISNIFFILFSLSFLEVKKHSPKLYMASLGLMMLPITSTFLNIIGFYTFSATAGTYVGIIICVWLIVLGFIMYRKHVKQTRFFLIGWGSFFLGILILNSALNGWIPVTPFTFNAAVFGTLFEVLLISSALADRINFLRLNHDRERHGRIRLMKQQNVWLEENVKLRTKELFDKSLEIESQNEELKQQHEELSATHEVVEKQKALVEEQNRKIEDINHALEQKVQERTLQLEETVKSLIRQNHDLEQFSYIVSHNMRAPVARIMGLLNLLEFDSSDDEERKDILAFLKDSAYGVDQIIHDLSQIIAIRKGLDTVMEKVNIEHILRHNQSDLTDEIAKASAQIVQKVEVTEFISVKGYIQSILYNLLSNAIKYRDPERKSIIVISAYEKEGNVVFEVTDNGLGIDLPPDRLNEIFHLYKRLHTHVQGKGLGLYLVKSQVEGLHGTIDVRTARGKGTTFIVTIPKN